MCWLLPKAAIFFSLENEVLVRVSSLNSGWPHFFETGFSGSPGTLHR